jgi:hypothetical protein
VPHQQGPYQQWPAWGPPQPPRKRSAAPAIAIGLIVVLVFAGLAVALVYLGSQAAPLLDRTEFADLYVGQCFNGGRVQASAEIVFGASVVDCAAPHESELAASFLYPGAVAGTPYPGEAVVTDYAQGECSRRFGEFVGTPYESSELGMTYLYPLRVNWTAGDYSIQCVVHAPDGEATSTGSFRDSRR